MANSFASFVVRHRVLLVVMSVMLTALSIAGILRLDVDADLTLLLNQHDKVVQDYSRFANDVGLADAFILIVQRRDQNAEPLTAIVDRLKKLDLVVEVSALGNTGYGDVSGQDDSMSHVILVKPSFKPTEIAMARGLSRDIRESAEESGWQAGLTGSYQVMMESSDSINKDMMKATLITTVGTAVLLLVIFRLPIVTVLIVATTLAIGLCCTLGVVWLVLGKLNLLTAVLPSVLLGLGVDFSLHFAFLFNDMARQPASGDTPEIAAASRYEFVSYAYSRTLNPMFVSAVTTAAAFLALCFSKSRGLFEMGLVGAIGIMVILLTTVILVPILLTSVPVTFHRQIRGAGNFWVRLYCLLCPQRPWVVAAMIVLVIGAGFYSSKVSFNLDQNKIIDRRIESIDLQEVLERRYHFSTVPIVFISPDANTEQSKMAFIMSNCSRTFGFLQSASVAPLLGLNPGNFKGKDGSFITLAYPKENPFIESAFHDVSQAALQVQEHFPDERNVVTGSPYLNAVMKDTVKADIFRCTAVAAAFVVAVVLIGFKHLGRAVMVLLPIILGALFTAGLMGVLGININIMTVVVLPLVIGSGIDYAVYVVHRWHKEQHIVDKTIAGVAGPVVVTTLTSMIGFGSLMIARNPGLRELGLAIAIGLGVCMVISLGFLPLLLGNKKSEQ